MKKLSYIRIIQIILAVLIILSLSAFAVITTKESKRKQAAEAELQAAIDNAVAVCTSYEEKIEIEENLKADLDIYAANIANTSSMEEKAYYTDIMLTYTQNRVNMNDPKSLYELAVELGNSYEASGEQITAYNLYKNELSAALEQFKAADNKYKNNN